MSAMLIKYRFLLRPALFWLALSFIIPISNGQGFWNTTATAPGKPATGVAFAGDSCLVIGFTTGIMRSVDAGSSFDITLTAPAIFHVMATSEGTVMAGGVGKIYRSFDLGQTWDSIPINSIYPVTKIMIDPSGHLFAITGALSIELGFVGDGVFFSEDGGTTWEQRNNGLGIYRCAESIAVDKNGRLYLAMADEYVTGQGGLFISDDQGLQWQHIDIRIDGQGVVTDQIKIANTFGLSVSPSDSVYFSFSGTAGNALVTLNTKKSIEDIPDNGSWLIYPVFGSISWWLDRILYDIHFAANGDWYSSTRGTTKSGGTYYSNDGGLHWEFIGQDLGVGLNGLRNKQYFCENSSGKIFMAQLLDQNLYYREKSSGDTGPDTPPKAWITLSPNPVKKSGTVRLDLSGIDHPVRISIFDGFGNKLYSMQADDHFVEFQSPGNTGLYLIVIQNNRTKIVTKLIITS